MSKLKNWLPMWSQARTRVSQRPDKAVAGIVLNHTNRQPLGYPPANHISSSFNEIASQMGIPGISKRLNQSRVEPPLLGDLPRHICDSSTVAAQNKATDALHSPPKRPVGILGS